MGTGIPDIDRDACIGCGNCVEWCPAGAVDMRAGKAVIISPRDCCYCTDCEEVCPSGAIKCPFEIILVADKSGKNAGK